MPFDPFQGFIALPASFSGSPFAAPTAVVALLAMTTGVFVVVRERGRQVSLSFFAVTLALAVYQGAFSLMLRAPHESAAIWWSGVAYLGVPFIVPAVYHFSVDLLGLVERKRMVVVAWLIGLLHAELCLGTDLVLDGVMRTEWGYFTRLTLWNLPFFAWSVGLLGLLIRDYLRVYREAAPLQQARIRWLAFPLAVAALGFIDYAPSMGLPVVPIGFAFFPVFLLSAAWAVGRYHLPELTPALVADQVVAAVTEPLFVCEPGGHIALANPAATRLLGRTAVELKGLPVCDLFSGGGPGHPFPPSAGSPFQEEEMELVGGHGQSIAVAVSTACLSRRRGTPLGFVVVARDIREQKRAAASQKRREQHFRALIENALDTITIVDGEGRISYQSPSVREVLGFDPADDLGRSIFERVHPEDRPGLEAIFATLVEQPDGVAEVEGRIIDARGGERVLGIRATNLLHHPAVRGVVLNARDVTEERLLQAELQHAQKMEAVGRLAGGVAHDFNNILTAIQGYVSLMREELPEGSPLAADLDEVRRGADRAARLTDQLLAFGRRQVVRPEVLDLNEVIDGMRSMLQRLITEEIRMETRLDPEPALVRVDRGHVEQMLMNLVVNARDAMPGGGRLRIGSRRVELDAAAADALDYSVAPGRYVLMTVTDDGSGMDDITRSHAFEPFFTTKPPGQGTGLGLSTVYGCVRQADGYVGIESELDRGTEFRIYLPLLDATTAAPPPAAEPPAAADSGRAAGGTVLVVEDEDPVRMLIRKILSRRGYTVLVAGDGAEALSTAEAHPGALDLLIADLVMPGMSGRQVAEQLRLTRPDLPVIFISGYTADEVVRRGITAREHVFLPKPFTPDDLTRAVVEVLDARPVARV